MQKLHENQTRLHTHRQWKYDNIQTNCKPDSFTRENMNTWGTGTVPLYVPDHGMYVIPNPACNSLPELEGKSMVAKQREYE